MISDAAPTSCATSSAALARYEQLRQHVLGQTHDACGAPGLALVMRGGMPALLVTNVESAGAVAVAASTDANGEDRSGMGVGMRKEIARVMVAMALKAATRREAQV
jgi:hypothetical protein